MAKINLKNKWMEILLGAVLALAGLVVIILGIVNPGILSTALSYIIAVALFFVGAMYLVNGLSKTANANIIDTSYILAAIAIALGVALVVDPTIVSSLIVYVVAIGILTFGVAILIRGIILCVKRASTTNCVVAIIVGVILITLGVLALIFQSNLSQIIQISAGVLLLVIGVIQIVETTKK